MESTDDTYHGAWIVAEATLGLLERCPIVSVTDEAVEREDQIMARQEHVVMQQHLAVNCTSGSLLNPSRAPSRAESSSLPDWVKASFLEAKAKRNQTQ